MKLNETYLLFTADHCPRKAADRYRQRVGGECKWWYENGYLVVGPVEVKDE